ncbi:MAG TPA: hypothetical protein VII08_10550 [Myxococcales bacterium]
MDLEHFKSALETGDTLRKLLADANEENISLRIDRGNLEKRVTELRAELDAMTGLRDAAAAGVVRFGEELRAATAANTRLMQEARRFYLADGTYIELDPAEVIERRKAAAVENTRQREEIEEKDETLTAMQDECLTQRKRAQVAEALNTPLRERVAALEKQLSERGTCDAWVELGPLWWGRCDLSPGHDGECQHKRVGTMPDGRELAERPAVTGTTSDKPAICQLDAPGCGVCDETTE